MRQRRWRSKGAWTPFTFLNAFILLYDYVTTVCLFRRSHSCLRFYLCELLKSRIYHFYLGNFNSHSCSRNPRAAFVAHDGGSKQVGRFVAIIVIWAAKIRRCVFSSIDSKPSTFAVAATGQECMWSMSLGKRMKLGLDNSEFDWVQLGLISFYFQIVSPLLPKGNVTDVESSTADGIKREWNKPIRNWINLFHFDFPN